MRNPIKFTDEAIISAMRATGGDRAKAAAILGCSVTTIVERAASLAARGVSLPRKPPFRRLTKRKESAVHRLRGKGLTIEAIAAEVGIGTTTVKAVLARVRGDGPLSFAQVRQYAQRALRLQPRQARDFGTCDVIPLELQPEHEARRLEVHARRMADAMRAERE